VGSDRRRESVLVTGATGFVGSAVVRRLLAEGHEVTGLVRDPDRARGLARLGMRTLTGDMLDPASYEQAAQRSGAVVHCAQLAPGRRLTRRRAARMAAANMVTTRALARACLRGGGRLLYTSGSFVYGDHGDAWITERTPLTPSPLGEGHAAGVRHLRELAPRGLRFAVLTPGFVYGPGGNFKAAFHDQAAAGRLRCIGHGANYWSCVHVDDLAGAYAAALAGAPPGAEYNVVDDKPLTLRELVDRVAAGTGGGGRPGSVPPVLAGLVVGRPVVASLTTSYRVSGALIREELGWRPAYPTLAEGLPPTLAALARRGVPAAENATTAADS
jgi:2-alkyl-3-oxoalkanoate reductase